MPVSKAPFLSSPVVGFFPATPANVVAGTVTVSAPAPGNFGIALGNTDTGIFQFPIPGLGQCPAEALPPYEQYNNSVAVELDQNLLTVNYSAAGDALVVAAVGIYATYYDATGATVTTLLDQTALPTDIGTYAAQIPINKLPAVPVPNSVVVVILEMVTSGNGTAVINGISVN
jgi:hypothetical protein